MDGRRASLDRAIISLLTLLGLAVRAPGIAHQPLQWDEGWSIALARLPVGEALRLTALDVHPPLYYLMLHAWTAKLGTTSFAVRALSLLIAALTVPLAAAAARAWWPSDTADARPRRVAGWAAAVAGALAPPLVYYAGVGRMYAPAAVGALAAAWGIAVWMGVDGARVSGRRRTRGLVVAVAGSVGALLSFYYSGFALAGVGLAALGVRPRAWRRWAVWVGATAALVVPWLFLALPQLASRMAARAAVDEAAGSDALLSLAAPLASAWQAVLFVNEGGVLPAAVVALALAGALVGACVVMPADAMARGRLAAAGLPIVLVCLAAAVGARAHMFAPRYVSVATPFLALGIGWATAGAVRLRWTTLPAIIAGVGMAWPTLSGAIYDRSAEWFDEYDPGAIHRAVLELARPSDVVAFNILSLAGAYDSHSESHRISSHRNSERGGRGSPAWTFAQLWDPVHEPPKPAIQRVEDAYETLLRGDNPGTAALWLALYKGTAASDTAMLKAWADAALFPTAGRWVSDTLLVGYIGAPIDATREFDPAVVFGDGITLRRARFTASAPPGGNVAISLRWWADAQPMHDARVVTRLVDHEGRTVAQRDSVPVSESRPTSSWLADESLDDRHGLRLPVGVEGPVQIVVGLVDESGNAIGDAVEVGLVEIEVPAR